MFAAIDNGIATDTRRLLFTGIIESMGTIRAIRSMPAGARMTTSAPGIAAALKVGDSVAVNGVCLTVVHCAKDMFTCDLSSETLARSSFGLAREGTPVNLERALLTGSRMGGHFVQGHVDGMGTLQFSVPSGQGNVMTFEFPRELERYLVNKGSIAVDGISLTIAGLTGSRFSVAVIPHTLQATNLGSLRAGDHVNLEVDILAKYFERFFQLGVMPDKSSKWSSEYLREQGF
jgi:riboflavin synthase